MVSLAPCTPNATLLARSYPMPRRFPFGTPFNLVMETIPGSCNLYDGVQVELDDGSKRSICQMFSDGVLMQPEVHSRQIISSFLGDCRMRADTPCRAVDLGANNGWLASMMLALGVTDLVAVEPQPDLARALRDTVKLNCWDRPTVRILNGFVTIGDEKRGEPVTVSCRGYRLGLRGGHELKNACPGAVHVPMADIFTHSHYHFVKIDVDGLDGEIIEWLANRIRKGTLQVDTLFVECSRCNPKTLFAYQKELNYSAYLLDKCDERRDLDEKGVDIANGYRPFDLDPILEEHYGQRFLRHVFYVKPSADLTAWTRINQVRKPRPKGPAPNGKFILGPREYVFTKERLLEPEMNALILDKYVGGGNEGVKTGKKSDTLKGLMQTIGSGARGWVAGVYGR